jgi:protein-tyrosine phosphatase/nicotinamidase-related amidase
MSNAILITQCLQNDFVQPVDIHDPLPNALHIGYQESKRLIGEFPKEGMLMSLMKWAYDQKQDDLEIINIRDWHDLNDLAQITHLAQFGPHCLQNTKGAEFVFEGVRKKEREVIINASGLNDFLETDLEKTLAKYKGQETRIGLIGVWTEAKITYLCYELASRYPNFEIAVCNALTASSSTHMHFVSLEQLKKILGIKLFSSVTEFAAFLKGETVTLSENKQIKESHLKISFESEYKLADEDRGIINYLFRNSRSAEFKVLDGGFSGNVVLKAKTTDIHGHEEVATVIKIGSRNPISGERDSFERVRDILGNSAPSIVDYTETENRAGIKYRYASMFDDKVTTLQNFYSKSNDLNKVFNFLDIVFKKQLGRFYKAATSEKLDLLKYYDFNGKYAASVLKKTESIAGKVDPGSDTIQLEGRTCFNLFKFYSEDLKNTDSKVVHSHYMSYVHGDLNGANIIIDAQENVWLIDFFHTHRGHVLKDLIKLENDLTYIFMKIDSKEEFEEACHYIDTILNVEDLWDELPTRSFKFEQLSKAYSVLKHLRAYYKELIHSDRSPHQLFIGLLRYSVHTLSFDECNDWQKKLALYSSCKLAEKVKQFIAMEDELRIDYLNEVSEIGMTILPGRKDRKRNLDSDISVIRKQDIKKVICLISPDEFTSYGVPDLLEKYKANGLNVKHVSIVDQGIPTAEEVKQLTSEINTSVTNKEKILIHCVGGLGRTGLLAACYLKEYRKLSAADSIKKVREARSPRAIESEAQENFVEQYV